MSAKVHSAVSRAATDQQPSGQQQWPLPEANAEAIDFLNSLREEELDLVLFSETLAIVSDTGKPRGELTIEVQRGKYEDTPGILSHCLLVHALSQGFLDEALCGNSLLGYLTENLEPMEQHSHEYIKFPILPMERKMSLMRQDDQLEVTRSVKEGEDVKTTTTSFPWHSLAGFISNAANLVLLRVMAWRKTVPSNASFLALDNEGKLCRCTYQALGCQTIQMGQEKAEMFIVEQTLHPDDGIPFSCQFYLLSDGHLAKRVQVGSPGCCIISKMPILREMDEIEPPPKFEKKPLEWEEDLELYSRFLDRKEQLRLSHVSYLRQHPEIRAAVSDFLLSLLIHRPEDVVTYAAEHFANYSSKRPPRPKLRSSHPPSPFRTLEEAET